MLTRIADSAGFAAAALPAAVGTTPAVLPAVACYQTNNPANGVWLTVADSWSATTAYCGLVFSGGVWNVTMSDMIPGWTAAWVVTY